MDGWMDGWTDGWMDSRTDGGQNLLKSCVFATRNCYNIWQQ